MMKPIKLPYRPDVGSAAQHERDSREVEHRPSMAGSGISGPIQTQAQIKHGVEDPDAMIKNRVSFLYSLCNGVWVKPLQELSSAVQIRQTGGQMHGGTDAERLQYFGGFCSGEGAFQVGIGQVR